MLRGPLSSIPAALLLALDLAAQAPVIVEQGASPERLAALAAQIRPSPRQARWQEIGFSAFVHFGMNTFTDREWGTGDESPEQFAPTDFDARSWARTFAAAGMKGVVLTAKHRDGFCLWPTKTTGHSVRRSPLRGWKGDVVREVADACRAEGLSFGVYLSPWDRHEKTFGTGTYDRIFHEQLRELCTDYGELFEVWFDGAHCPADDPDVFDRQSHFRLARELQPAAVLAVTGPDVRWVGNEAGRPREREWSVLTLDTAGAGDFVDSREVWRSFWRLAGRAEEADLGSIEKLRGARWLIWWPAETDVSIRPGWFHHPVEDSRVKSLDELLDCWFGAVGNNSALLLNVPPDRRGRIAKPDEEALLDLGDWLRFAFGRAIEGERKRYARAEEILFSKDARVDMVDLREDVAGSGQRVDRFRIDAFDGISWRTAHRGGTVGARRCVQLPSMTVRGIRYAIEKARGEPAIASFSARKMPEIPSPPVVERDREGMASIRAESPVRYSVDGGPPTPYEGSFPLPLGGEIRAMAVGGDLALRRGSSASAVFGLCPARFSIADCDSEQGGGESASDTIDGNPATIWHSRWSPTSPGHPHHLLIDLGQAIEIRGFVYTPRRDGTNGTVLDYAFEAGPDRDHLRRVAEGMFEGMREHPSTRAVRLSEPVSGVRFVRFVGLSEVRGRPWSSCAEFTVLVR
ncbi:MAG: hypothetical protein Fur0037_14670 [Planctomycetota bacterium]